MLASSNPLQHKPHHVLRRFQYCVLLHLTKSHQSIGYTKSYIKPSQSNLLSNYIQIVDTLWVKHATHQNDESLRTASPSNLGDIVNNSSNFSTKYAEFSTKW